MQRSRYGAFNGGDGCSTIGGYVLATRMYGSSLTRFGNSTLIHQGALDMARLNGFIKSICLVKTGALRIEWH